MTALIEAALTHSRTVLSLLLLLLIGGTYAYIAIPKEADPDVNIPVIYAQVHHEGISPEDSERLLVQPLEQELRSVEGVDEMRSIAYQGGANVILEFEAGFDADAAMQDVREKVDLAEPELPEEADEPTVHEVNLSLFPVLVVTLSGEVPERALLSLARDLRDEIEALPPVLDVEIAGDREELVELIVDPIVMESYGIDARQVMEAVSRSNRLVAAGSLDTGGGRFAIKVPGLFSDPQDILDMPVKVSGDAAVTFADIGTLRRTFKDPETFARINGERGIALEVSKRTGENIIETIEQVRATVEKGRANWPDVVSVTYSQDKSANIRTMLSDLQNNVLAAVILVMVVIVAALGVRSAGFVGLAIPGSFLTGILVLYLAGLTVNVVVLFSLILAVGMLVDGAIVVVEYADRKLREGKSAHEAYGLAAKRMAWPIIAATATTLAAFLPLVFWPGIVGEFMKFLPITLLATLTASLAMALVFVPTLGSITGRGVASGGVDSEKARAIAAGSTGDLTRLSGITGAYLRVLRAALRHPAKVILAALVMLVAVQYAYSQFGRGVEFFPDVEPDNAVLQVHGRGNLSIHQRDRLVKEVESRVLQLHREKQEFHAIYARSQLLSGQQRDEPEDIIGTITLEFVDWWNRRPASEIIADIKQRTANLAGIRVESEEQQMGPPTGKPIQIEVAANDPDQLAPVVGEIVERMRRDGEYTNIEDSRPIPGIEWELEVDRAQAAKFGADVSLLGSYVQMMTNGLKLGEYRVSDADEEIDIVVRFPESQRSLDRLDQIRMETGSGNIPASNFVERRPEHRTNLIRRTDSRRVLTIKADVPPGVLADDKVRDLQGWLDTRDLPRGVDIAFKGEEEEQKEAASFLTKAFVVALFLMAIILVTQFNSFYSAFLILSAVVLSTIGVMTGLLVTNQPFGIVMTGIGVIALAGIVVNNNIVLIDTFDRLRKHEPDVLQAILRTGAQRLRPVGLTTITTILGLMPMVLGTNIDFLNRLVQTGAPSTELWRQLSTAIVFGLTFATVLTLIITPCALMFRANVAAWRDRRKGREMAQPPVSTGSEAPQLPHAAE
ncbi:efflux RND transporter permease subunit [Ferruginivarius sediminum]|uniref:AcrB/AcrD/AcrF family protein n=1 Tax=Ferruginivarius sediminum TaxID=2661937 RepID=A0A369TA12_9PROT|nr:efflux RND transporter permease subunit [Ferruginivarius sediminum]RDD61334.1 AcrB/AcrD/AcrF family protein [Ferruginivarius sediminum]